MWSTQQRLRGGSSRGIGHSPTRAGRALQVATSLSGAVIRSAIAARGRPDPVLLADNLATGFLKLGSAYLKLGQILASSPGVIGEDVAESFRRCLDTGDPIPAHALRAALARAAGRPLAEAYRTVDERAIGRASIAVVHRAVTSDGLDVAVKVRRPHIAKLVAVDLALLRGVQSVASMISRSSDGDLGELLDDFERTVVEELDLAEERRAMERTRSQLAGAELHRVTVPGTHPDLSNEEVLVMDLVVGCPIDDVQGIRDRGLDAGSLVDEVIRTWLVTSLSSAEFHGDCHAGNLLVLDDGRVALLDWGIVGHLTERAQRLCTNLLLGSLGATDAWEAVATDFRCQYGDRLTSGFGITPEELPAALRDLLGPLLTAPFGNRSIADFLDQVKLSAPDHSSREDASPESAEPDFDRGFFLWLKQLVFFERYARIHGRYRAISNYAAEALDGQPGFAVAYPRGKGITGLHHAGMVTHDLDATAEELEQLGFMVTTPTVPALLEHSGSLQPFGAANSHVDFSDGTFLETITVVDRGQAGPANAIPVRLQVPDRALPRLSELIESVLARLRHQLDRFEGLHVLVFTASEIYAEGRRLGDLGVAHSGVTSAARRASGSVAEPIHVVEIDDPRLPTPEGRLAFSSPVPAGPTRHPNGATALVEVILCAEPNDIRALTRRYAQLLGAAPTETSRGVTFAFESSALLITTPTQLERELPGEQPIAVPSFVAVTVDVEDLGATTDLLTTAGYQPRPTPCGEVFISAQEGPGAAIVFRQR